MMVPSLKRISNQNHFKENMHKVNRMVCQANKLIEQGYGLASPVIDAHVIFLILDFIIILAILIETF